MKRTYVIFSAILALCCLKGSAQNPLIQHHFSADPAPFVYNDRMYIYYDRDEGGSFYTMNEWRVISSSDLVNWTDHGDVLPITAFKWADADSHSAWASQCIERDGKFYWYICVQYKGDWRHTVGVAVSDKPEGPFKDALGKPLIPVTEGGQIDPTVFIDDDGQAYLYYGNNMLRYVKLNKDMISYDKTIGNNGVVTVPLTKEAFGGVKVKKTVNGEEQTVIDGVDAYEEGPWLHKYNGKYYLSYAAGGVPEHMSYSMSDSPTGPWKYAGVIMPTKNTGSFTNHGGVVEFRGHQYVAYHAGWLPGGGGFTRSACLAEFTYNEDGTIPQVTESKLGVQALGTLNPYEQQEAETMNTSTGLWVYTQENPRTIYVGNIDKGDTMRVRRVDFGETGAAAITARVSSAASTGYIEVRAKSRSGKLIAKVPVPCTGGDTNWVDVIVPVQNAVTDVNDILFYYNCTSSLAKEKTNTLTFDKWKFMPKTTERELLGINAVVAKSVIDTVAEYGNTSALTVTAVYSDGSTEDVTEQATVESDVPGMVEKDGQNIKGTGYGNGVLTIRYEGKTSTRYLTVRSYAAENTVTNIRFEGDGMKDDVCTMLTGSTVSLKAYAVYGDGHEKDITSAATVVNPSTDILTSSRVKLTAKKDGDAILQVRYKGAVGDSCIVPLNVAVRTFPLKSSMINPSIIGSGTFTESTLVLKSTTKDGLGGWQYSSSIDISGYACLVVRLKSASIGKPKFRLYNSTDTSDAYFSQDISKTETIIDLKDLVKSDGTALDLTKIRMAGISMGNSSGGSARLESILLSTEQVYPTAISDVEQTVETSTYYNINGQRVTNPQSGVFIHNGKKVLK